MWLSMRYTLFGREGMWISMCNALFGEGACKCSCTELIPNKGVMFYIDM